MGIYLDLQGAMCKSKYEYMKKNQSVGLHIVFNNLGKLKLLEDNDRYLFSVARIFCDTRKCTLEKILGCTWSIDHDQKELFKIRIYHKKE